MPKKFIRKCLLFTLVLTVLLALISPVFVYKTQHRAKLEEGLYLADDSYDVVFMGSSHMNGAMDPNVIWHEQGVTSYNFATGGQPVDVTYYLLKEVLKKQKSPMVVLDVFYLGMTTSYGAKGFVSNALDNMKFDRNKLEAIWNCTPIEDRLLYLLPVLKYHFRWSSLQQKDLSFDMDALYYEKGFVSGTDRYGKQNSAWKDTQNRVAIPQRSLEYLNKIVALCKENNCPLVFVNMPCDYSEPDSQDGWVDDTEALLNTVADFAEENGIPFLDFYDRRDEIGLDFASDMNNAGHLNLWGAVKVSSWFGSYLTQNYSLTDHRSDSAYAQWEQDYIHSQAATVA